MQTRDGPDRHAARRSDSPTAPPPGAARFRARRRPPVLGRSRLALPTSDGDAAAAMAAALIRDSRPSWSLLQGRSEASGARAAVLGGVVRRPDERVHELLKQGIAGRAGLQLNPPGGDDDRWFKTPVRGQVHVS